MRSPEVFLAKNSEILAGKNYGILYCKLHYSWSRVILNNFMLILNKSWVIICDYRVSLYDSSLLYDFRVILYDIHRLNFV
jgi:hypothetical protein